MRSIHSVLAAALLASLTLLAPSARAGDERPQLGNTSFESAGLDGWEVGIGARIAQRGGSSSVTVDSNVARTGKASLRCQGGTTTATWRMLTQTVPARPGERVLLTVAARSRGLKREGNQYANANALLIFLDEKGQRLAFLPSAVLEGDRDWVDLQVHAFAPPGTARMTVGLFASMTGIVWFDDVRLRVAPAAADTAEGRAAALAALQGHLERTYPFFGLPAKPKDAARMVARHRAAVIGAAGRTAFVTAVRKMLAELNDPHVVVRTREGVLPTMDKPYPPSSMWHRSAIERALVRTTFRKPFLLAGFLGEEADAIGYLLVATFQMKPEQEKEIANALGTLAAARALVLDVRPNGGGDEAVAQRLMARFAKKETVYVVGQMRDATRPTGFGVRYPRSLSPLSGKRPDARRVVVLQGPACMSSTEAFLLMARALGNCTTVGWRSRGASSYPQPFPLLSDVVLMLSTRRNLTPKDESFEGVGLAPDVEVAGKPDKQQDPALRKALELLRH